ncbi:HD domain-containing protein [Deinococcus detaillensis]|uniref:HD domain-containing protein n=1 Tax=Deinococcus detaillensis TaxID=2592048 RepID=A0A553UWC7_9DEIO|nr:HD domain-containing phosphohydrolase [Deinococcus detaillensis]TSA84499.1 HD domain-containing protein [Deinococcus detaillensis]
MTAASAPDNRDLTAQSVLRLVHIALEAKDLGTGVVPTLDELIQHTAAVGAAYFQLKLPSGEVQNAALPQALIYQVRAAAGEMPTTSGMRAVAAHGLPSDTPLMQALLTRRTPMFFDNTSVRPETIGFPELGVVSLAAAPVLGKRGELLGAFLMHTFEAHTWTEEEVRLFSSVVGTIAALMARLAAEEQVNAARESALRALGLALEARDRETQGHTDRVTALALRLARHLHLGEEQCQALRWGAYLHDIGKISIPDHILHKPSSLSEDEFELMRSHAEVGHRFASSLGFLPSESLEVVLHHHEKWNGKGYPRQLAGGDIHLLARIFSLCDVYDALISERPYKRAWTLEETHAELAAQAGQHFDPQVVSAFFELLRGDAAGASSNALIN